MPTAHLCLECPAVRRTHPVAVVAEAVVEVEVEVVAMVLQVVSEVIPEAVTQAVTARLPTEAMDILHTRNSTRSMRKLTRSNSQAGRRRNRHVTVADRPRRHRAIADPSRVRAASRPPKRLPRRAAVAAAAAARDRARARLSVSRCALRCIWRVPCMAACCVCVCVLFTRAARTCTRCRHAARSPSPSSPSRHCGKAPSR